MITFSHHVFGQKKENENVLLHPDKFYKKFFPKLKAKRNRNPPDTSYIKSYPNYLSVGLHILSPAISLNIKPRATQASGTDASSKFRTNIADIVGLSASYRFVSVGFAFLLKSKHTHNDYAPSYYRTATIKYNSNAYLFQFKYLRFKGFTDINQNNSFNPNQEYTKRPDMVSKEFQFEFQNNFSWKKYSYIAPINFSQRQVKSRAGILLKAGVYYNQISGDSSIINERQIQYDEAFRQVKAIRTLSIKIAPGIGANLVFLRRIYFSVAIFTSYDLYLYKYLNDVDEKVKGRQTFLSVLDGKTSLGYQSKRLYAGLRFEAERRGASLQSINVNAIYSYTGIEFGYRFDAPKVVKKVYKETMPPGM
jgi:hypothetical protein